MTQRPRFLSIGFSLLAVLCFSCTTHQRPVSQSGAQPATRGGSAGVATGVASAPGEVDGATSASRVAQTQVMNATGPGPTVIHAVAFAETDPISSLHGSFAEADPTQSQPGIEINELNSAEGRPMPDSAAGLVRRDATLKGMTSVEMVNAMPGPSLTFEGNSSANNTAVFGGTVAPPDTNGAVGPHHYVQMTNLLTGIYDKATGALLPPGRFALSPLFAKLGGVCAATNDGDPVVQYDKLADRWILSQFGFTATDAPPYHQCIAISKTADPAGAYYAYDFIQPGQEFPDYPKLGTWPDAYYMTTNQFFLGGSFDGGGAFALDRAKMLVGDPTATEIYFNLCFTAGHCAVNHPEGIFGMLPSDFDGLTPPPAGAKNIFTYPLSVSFGDAVDGARLFEFNVGSPFGTGATFTERADSPALLAAYDGRDPGGRGDVREPAPGENLESLASRFMHRLQYQNRGGIETWVSNITVNVGTGTSSTLYRAAPRYFELSRTSPGGVITTTEQATFAPDPVTANRGRWMGSAAEDASGNLALGFSRTSTTAGDFPSIMIAGRLVSDPPGGLFQGEALMFAGLGTQTGTSNRWGDYSAMQVDPVDYCTFWYTQEYNPAGNTSFNWRTRIGAFKFPSCVSPAMGQLTGTVTYCQNGQPIKGAVITVSDGHGSATIADGTYSINLPPGSYTVTATDAFANCGPSSSQTVNITNGGTSTANFCLTGTPLINFISSAFDDSLGNGNGIINRDECFKVSAVLENDGCFPETGISAVLSTSTAGVVVDQALSSYPNLAINASASNLTPYAAHTTPGFVCGTPIDFTLTESSAIGGVRVFSFSFPTCGGGAAQPFSGTLDNTDSVATAGRLGRNAVASACGTAKGCPGSFDANPRFFDTFTFSNTAAVSVCLTVTLDQSTCGNALLAAGYLDSFSGANLCLNYLGDAGGSANTSSFAVDVPGGHNLVLAIQQTTVGVFCPGGYSGTVTGFLDNTADGGACPACQLTTPVATSTLWPPNHNLINVGLSASSTGICPANRQVTVFSDEDDVDPLTDGDMSPDAKNIALGTLRLRAEREDSGDGRVYLVVVRTSDGTGNGAFSCSTVTVPPNQSAAGKANVAAQAAAAKTFCTTHAGAAPPGFFPVGDGPVIGPKQ